MRCEFKNLCSLLCSNLITSFGLSWPVVKSVFSRNLTAAALILTLLPGAISPAIADAASKPYLHLGEVTFGKDNYLVSMSNGMVSKVFVKAGEEVHDGTVLAIITPFNPSFEIQKIIHSGSPNLVSEILAREGRKVEQYQSVFRTNNKLDMLLQTVSHSKNNEQLFIGQQVDVIFNPGGNEYTVPGTTDAIHNIKESGERFANQQIDVAIDIPKCLGNDLCRRFLEPGRMAKLKFYPANE